MKSRLWHKARVSEPPTHLLKDPDLPGLQDIFFALVSLTEEDFHSCSEFTTIFTITRCLNVSVRELFFFRTPPVLSQILKMLRWEVLSSLKLLGFDSLFCKMLLCVPLSACATPPV